MDNLSNPSRRAHLRPRRVYATHTICRGDNLRLRTRLRTKHVWMKPFRKLTVLAHKFIRGICRPRSEHGVCLGKGIPDAMPRRPSAFACPTSTTRLNALFGLMPKRRTEHGSQRASEKPANASADKNPLQAHGNLAPQPKNALYRARTAALRSAVRMAIMNDTSDDPWFTMDIEIPAEARARHALASIPGV